MIQARPLLASVWMIGAIVSFTLMAVAGRTLVGAHDTFEIMFFRSLIGLVLVLGLGRATGHLHEISRQQIGTHLWRNLFHFTGQNLWFYALALIPLAHVFALEFTSPLWVMVLAALFLGERLTTTKILAATMAFTGVLLVVRPDTAALNPGHLTAAASAVAFAATAIFTKKLTATETITCILFWLTLTQAVFGAITVFADGVVQWPTLATAPWLVLVASAGLVAHFCLTTALSLAPASIVMPMDFARLPVVALVGYLFYSEALESLVIVGAVLILCANWVNIRASIRK